jgi:hypothetical protein
MGSFKINNIERIKAGDSPSPIPNSLAENIFEEVKDPQVSDNFTMAAKFMVPNIAENGTQGAFSKTDRKMRSISLPFGV